MLTFYHTLRSPFARKVRVLLAELDLEHQAVELPITRERGRVFPEDYEATVPTLKIPAIQDGERLVFDSNHICEYLLRTYPLQNPLHLDPPLATEITRPTHEWEDRMVLTTIDAALNSAFYLAILNFAGVEIKKFPFREREAHRIQAGLDWLEKRVTPEGYVPGVFSIVDLNLMCLLQWLEQRELARWRDRPNLEGLVARLEQRPTLAQNPLVFPDA